MARIRKFSSWKKRRRSEKRSAPTASESDIFGSFGCWTIIAIIIGFFHPLVGVCVFIFAITIALLPNKRPASVPTENIPEVVGESHYQAALARIVAGVPVRIGGVRHPVSVHLVAEPSNPHDRNAIAVFIGPDLVGYISRESLAAFGNKLREVIASGEVLGARVCGGPSPDRPRAMYGVFLDWGD